MSLINVYTNFNSRYYKYLRIFIKEAESGNINSQVLLNDLKKNNVNLDHIVWQKLVDEAKEVVVNDSTYELLPMGLINTNIPMYFIHTNEKENHVTRNTFRKMFLASSQFKPFYHSLDYLEIDYDNLDKLASSFIKYYHDSLGEEWTLEDFKKMLRDKKYLVVKYAMQVDTGEVFPVGFFGFDVRTCAGGKSLTNGELYVMDEFRGLGIANSLTTLVMEMAKMDGITNFDAITYRTPENDALGFWLKKGASKTGLYYIEGEVSNILKNTNKNRKQ